MNPNIKTTGITLTPAISSYINKNLEKVYRLVANDQSARISVEVGKTTSHHNKGDIFRAEIRISGAGKDFYASSEKPDLYTAIDDVHNEIVREITSGKDRKLSRMRRGGAKVKAMMKGLWNWRKR